ncbi:MAG: UDP-N-acetylglucosamine 2-epimerase (non-hydrolyzing) [Methanomassiliicoccales archaeon]|nr:MAG: UDP-N-acetylglucosamine 2-epimerase (non-hydrolyzing) [Methanomassiliicoccales archaeon]
MKFLSVVGARPQFVKLAPIHRAMKRHEHVIVHTGQHYDYKMSQVFFEVLNIPEPKHNLGIGSGAHGEQTARMLSAVEDVLMKERPDVVIVYGDTNSTLAGALAAVKMLMPVAHVEAGLRSYRRSMPEEINRVLTDHISSILFCPTDVASDNLRKEGITKNVHVVGDTMAQTLLEMCPRLDRSMVERYGVRVGGYVLATVHRQENADSRKNMSEILSAMADLGMDVVLPLHPRTVKNLNSWGMMDKALSSKNIKVVEPMDYVTFTAMEKHAAHILTDSGGVQKEAYILKVPCTTMRDETEWVETLDGGWNVLAGASKEKIVQAVLRPRPDAPQISYGDERVSERIVHILEEAFLS